jgi:hypothetical protein
MTTNNVIVFRPKNEMKIDFEQETVPFADADEYLEHVKSILVEEDYQLILCAILDPDYYDMLDEELKDIVHTYFELD